MLIDDHRKNGFTTGDCVLTKFTYKAKKNKAHWEKIIGKIKIQHFLVQYDLFLMTFDIRE